LIGARPGDTLSVRIGGQRLELPWADTYGSEGSRIVHVDSYGLMAFAVSGGRADEVLSISEGLSVGLGAAGGAQSSETS
ncbi:MAG TPA: hypothetical protein VMM81_07995, partial [Acidimicrobiia bacterium]|nr:hypothetical protein [Acidimicrobiia bacterium]